MIGVALVRVGPLIVIPSLIEELGQDITELLSDGTLRPDDLRNPDSWVSYVALSDVIARLASIANREDMGLTLGRRSQLTALGIPALMVRFAPDVRTAVEAMVKYLDLHDQGGLLYLNVQKHYSQLGYVIRQSGVAAIDQIYDLALAQLIRLLSEACGSGFQPYSVNLSRSTPRNTSPYRELFGPRVTFNAPQSEIVFQTHWLDRANPNSDVHLFRHFYRYAEEMEAKRPHDAVETMRRFIHQSVLSGAVNYKEVAMSFGLKERTLNRRLEVNGISFRTELNKIRYERAKQLLSATSMSIAEIATELNYSDASAFVRAFKTWSGTSPGNWRSRWYRKVQHS